LTAIQLRTASVASARVWSQSGNLRRWHQARRVLDHCADPIYLAPRLYLVVSLPHRHAAQQLSKSGIDPSIWRLAIQHSGVNSRRSGQLLRHPPARDGGYITSVWPICTSAVFQRLATNLFIHHKPEYPHVSA